MLAWSSVGTDSLLEPASSGRERHCRFWIHVSASKDAAWFLLTRKWNNELRLDLRRRSFRKTRVTPVSWLVTSFWWHRFTISVLQQTVTLFIWSSETPHVKLVAQFKQGQKISCLWPLTTEHIFLWIMSCYGCRKGRDLASLSGHVMDICCWNKFKNQRRDGQRTKTWIDILFMSRETRRDFTSCVSLQTADQSDQ